MQNPKFTGMWLGKTGDGNSWYHIYPFAQNKFSEKLHVVRYKKPFQKVPNAIFHTFKSINLPFDIVSIFFTGLKVLIKYKIDYIITFNPKPWGLVAWLLAKLFQKPLILGYIGKDFNHDLQKGKIRKVLKYITLKSDVVTITGSSMYDYLVNIGVDPKSVFVYPHCVNDNWFKSGINNNYEYDLITIGELIERKRIHDIIDAVKIVTDAGIVLKLCIVGNGPLYSSLERYSKDKNLEHYIEFTGFQKDVLSYLKKSKIYVQASRSEGLSISLIEAMAAGLVPIATIAGSEKDIIDHKKNGILIEVGRPDQIADAIKELQNPDIYKRYKDNVLNERNKFKIDAAIETCEEIINKILL